MALLAARAEAGAGMVGEEAADTMIGEATRTSSLCRQEVGIKIESVTEMEAGVGMEDTRGHTRAGMTTRARAGGTDEQGCINSGYGKITQMNKVTWVSRLTAQARDSQISKETTKWQRWKYQR